MDKEPTQGFEFVVTESSENAASETARQTVNGTNQRAAQNSAKEDGTDSETEAFDFVPLTPPKKRGRPSGSKTVSKPTAAEAVETASMLLAMFDGVAASAYGEQGKLALNERVLIQGGLQRTLSRMSPAAAKRYGGILDPLMIGAGFTLWFVRTRSLGKKQREVVDEAERIVASANAPAAPQGETASVNGPITAAPPPSEIHTLFEANNGL